MARRITVEWIAGGGHGDLIAIDNVSLTQIGGTGANLLVNGDFGSGSYYVGGNVDATARTLTIDVTPVNDAPVAVADVYSGTAVVEAGSAVAGQATASGNVLTNDTDVDAGDSKTVTTAGTFSGTYGTLQLNADGSYTYTLDNNLAATQALAQGQQVNEVFNYTMKDGAGATSSATLTIGVTGSVDNRAPTTAVAAESVTGNEDNTINGTLLTGADADGDALTYQIVTGSATNGTVTITNAATGAFSFTPNANYSGPASFQYVINDGTTNSTAKTVNVTVNGGGGCADTGHWKCTCGSSALHRCRHGNRCACEYHQVPAYAGIGSARWWWLRIADCGN